MRDPVTAQQFIAAAPWRFAKTMPEEPHEYTVRGETPGAEFEWFVAHVREHGHPQSYGDRYYTYLQVDGWRYWTMGAPVEETIIINRARVGEGRQEAGNA